MGSNASSMLVKPEQLVRLLIAFPIVVKNHLRDECTQPTELAAAESAGSNDASVPNLHVLATAASPPNACIEAMAQAIRGGLKMDDGLGASAYMHLSDDCRALTQAATACERIKSSPMPLGYVSALRFFLLVWLFTLPLTLIGPYGGAAVPAVAAISFCFLNLENVAMEIEQPFGTVWDKQLDPQNFVSRVFEFALETPAWFDLSSAAGCQRLAFGGILCRHRTCVARPS